MLLDWFDIRSFLLFFLVFAPLEHLLPLRDAKKVLRAGFATDVLHVFVSGFFIRVGMFLVVWWATQAGSWAVPALWRETLAAWPLWLQVVAVTVIADLGFYLSHRLMHSVPVLWHFHAVHHSSEEMDWLASFRVHPVDQVIVKGTSLLPVFALGFATEAIAIAGVIYQWQALLIHSNVRVSFGPLRWLVASPEFHHWHHSNHREAYDKNFSGQLLLWDLLFRTVHLPKGAMPERYGINDPVPRDYALQITYPFKRVLQTATEPRADKAAGAASPSVAPSTGAATVSSRGR